MNKIDFSNYSLPRYQAIPNVGLYLKQVVIFINEATEPLFHTSVTTTMLSNYVKLHLVSSPVKKMYSRDQIANLLMIVLIKNVLSLDNIKKYLSLHEDSSDISASYDYFCETFENMLKKVSGEDIDVMEEKEPDVKQYLLKHIVTTLVHKIYMDESFLSLE